MSDDGVWLLGIPDGVALETMQLESEINAWYQAAKRTGIELQSPYAIDAAVLQSASSLSRLAVGVVSRPGHVISIETSSASMRSGASMVIVVVIRTSTVIRDPLPSVRRVSIGRFAIVQWFVPSDASRIEPLRVSFLEVGALAAPTASGSSGLPADRRPGSLSGAYGCPVADVDGRVRLLRPMDDYVGRWKDEAYCYVSDDEPDRDPALVTYGSCEALGKVLAKSPLVLGPAKTARTRDVNETVITQKCVFRTRREKATDAEALALRELITPAGRASACGTNCAQRAADLSSLADSLERRLADLKEQADRSRSAKVDWEAAVSGLASCRAGVSDCSDRARRLSNVASRNASTTAIDLTECESNLAAMYRRIWEDEACCTSADDYRRRYQDQILKNKALRDAIDAALANGTDDVWRKLYDGYAVVAGKQYCLLR